MARARPARATAWSFAEDSGHEWESQTINRMTPYMFMAPAVVIMWHRPAVSAWATWSMESFRDWDPSQSIGETEFVGLKNYITLFFDPAFPGEPGRHADLRVYGGRCRDGDRGRPGLAA